MSNINDFRIVNGKLSEYTGTDTEVAIPHLVSEIGSSAFSNG